ncbi:Na/Pi symporter [Devosia sp. A8/3-2]|nr:Na/Pi symporter [Devosia sp. A8/3-2]
MEVDLFKEIIVPVIGGLGIFMLGLEFMANGIRALSVNKMREWLARMAGTPVKGVLAGTLITGIIQSSTAMTVMTVGTVNAGVLGLRSAISVIMGANIGTTLGNGLIALPLGPPGLLFGGVFSLVYCFAKNDRLRNIAPACMGFALIFYGLNLMTGGLKPLRNMPEVLSVIQTLDASNFGGVIICVMIAAGITALIHSSSATIGIVMGTGASGILSGKPPLPLPSVPIWAPPSPRGWPRSICPRMPSGPLTPISASTSSASALSWRCSSRRSGCLARSCTCGALIRARR